MLNLPIFACPPIRSICHFCLILISVFFASELYAVSNAVLSDYSLIENDAVTRLIIHFKQPLSYRSHFPQTSGERIEINLRRLLVINSATPPELRDVLPPAKKDSSILATGIHYEETDPQNGMLQIEFKRTVDFTIITAKDNRSIEIVINKQRVTKSQAIKSIDPTSGLPVYVINLLSTTDPIDAENQPALVNYKKHNFDIYVIQDEINHKTSYNLRLGYFLSNSLANQNLQRLKTVFPNAWLDKVSDTRRKIAEEWFAARQITGLQTAAKKPIQSGDKLDNLLERAKQAMIDKDYRSAIRYFTKILQSDDTRYHKESLELLGVARERNDQIAHAKAEYEEYLRRYPEGEDAERVKQRLRGLLTARAAPKEKLATPEKKEDEPNWEMFGSFSQFYRNQANKTDVTPSTTTESSLASDIVLSGRKRGSAWSQRFDFVANHFYDFQEEVDASEGNVYTLFYDLSSNDNDLSMRLGRQTHSSDGVLGRFDGLIVKKRIGNNKRLNFLAGYPVELSIEDGIRTNRQFYAVSMDFESLFNKTDVKLYYIDQTNDGLTDRKAVGSEVQYIDDTSSYFLLLDYDTFYGKLNQATFVGNWRYKDNSSLNVVADSRNSPLLTTYNALIGQGLTSIEELNQIFTEDEIYQLARDRTTDFKALTVGYSRPLSTKYQFTTDLSVSKLGSTPASGGVDATMGTDTEYYLNMALLVNGLFTDNDITIVGARYSDATTSDTSSLNFSSRFSVGQKWRINPRLYIDFRTNDNGSERTTYKPKLILNYRSSRNLRYDIELGYEYSETDAGATTTTDELYYVYLGYIFDF